MSFLKPSPGGTRRFSRGTTQPSKCSSPSGMPRSPIMNSRRPILNPGVSRSTRTPPIPSAPGRPPKRANTRYRREVPAPVIQLLWPSSLRPPGASSAAVVRAVAAQPAGGGPAGLAWDRHAHEPRRDEVLHVLPRVLLGGVPAGRAGGEDRVGQLARPAPERLLLGRQLELPGGAPLGPSEGIGEQ